MSQLARRLTAAVLLVAILAMAAPAGAAAPPRQHSAPAPTVLGTGLLHQVLTWLGSLWKTLPVSGSTDSDSDKPRPVDLYRGGMIDPNG